MTSPKESRIPSIESFRVLAIFAVVVIHVCPFYAMGEKDARYKILAYMILSLCRFAVPFFFLVGGYFLGKSLQKGSSPAELLLRNLKRLGLLFLAWSFLYAFLPPVAYKEGSVLSWLGSGPSAALLKIQTDFLNFIINVMVFYGTFMCVCDFDFFYS